MGAPGFWMAEESGLLKPVVEKYLKGGHLEGEELVVMRAYLKQWIDAPWSDGDELEALRAQAAAIESHADVDTWLEAALWLGIDPL